ncbi:hypothetical protein [Sphingorhabdus sp. 109]|jgi:hypothetical protein|uniref:hypothetical protein n=1 Tax=Sphingorhabdus sp. 109 TaxID=2653173 RepID=UPI0012F41A12|nr:hypothetical protein [Sphingorhabdus sp. 109]VWX57619.1 conserved exported hypothetical protein [Sphingorhabdus sp. 109]
MKFATMAASLASLTLAASPVAAQSSNSVSSAIQRTDATPGNLEKLEGENGILIALLAAAAVIAGIIIIADGDDEPTSP